MMKETLAGQIALVLALFSTAGLLSCGGKNTPLDAETRIAIDSTANAQIELARKEIDSLCVVAEKTQMKQLVDSIKAVRLQEIQEQLKSVPR
jgi:hypothetical protein